MQAENNDIDAGNYDKLKYDYGTCLVSGVDCMNQLADGNVALIGLSLDAGADVALIEY
jgi:hypothetical protein